MSQEVAERFKEALWKLEEDRDVEALVEIHAEDCSVGNVAAPKKATTGCASSGPTTATRSTR
ncbi:MAG: hypothetical protein LC781_19260 [Actinobacteria bacterium]|nr:hypothetical protein [Actinomycetota bacterium]